MTITEEQLRAEIKELADTETQTGLAKRLGYKVSTIHDVLKGRQYISKNLALALGYKAIVEKTVIRSYEKVESARKGEKDASKSKEAKG